VRLAHRPPDQLTIGKTSTGVAELQIDIPTEPNTPATIEPIAAPSSFHITMSLAASRAVLRHTTFAARRAGIRNASTTSEATAAAKQKTSEAAGTAKERASDAAASAKQRAAEFQSKASEGLSRVSSSAGAALSKAGSALGNSAEALSKAGGRTGQVAGSVQC
jgi:hypothetical protein